MRGLLRRRQPPAPIISFFYNTKFYFTNKNYAGKQYYRPNPGTIEQALREKKTLHIKKEIETRKALSLARPSAITFASGGTKK